MDQETASGRKLTTQNAWETGQDLFGKYASGRDNLSSNRKEILKEKLRTKVTRK